MGSWKGQFPVVVSRDGSAAGDGRAVTLGQPNCQGVGQFTDHDTCETFTIKGRADQKQFTLKTKFVAVSSPSGHDHTGFAPAFFSGQGLPGAMYVISITAPGIAETESTQSWKFDAFTFGTSIITIHMKCTSCR